MKKYEIFPIIFWILLSLFVMALSSKLAPGRLHDSGPGFMPFLSGLMLLIISFYLLIKSIKMGRRNEKKEKSQINFKKLSLVLASLFAYALLLETLGFLINTTLVLILLFRTAGFRKWSTIILASGLTVLLTYFVFTFFGVRFPMGILKLR